MLASNVQNFFAFVPAPANEGKVKAMVHAMAVFSFGCLRSE